MAQYNYTITLNLGIPVTLIAAAATTGTSVSQQFCTQGTDKVYAEVNGTFSVCTVDLERSTDGGTTWIAVTGQTALDLAANKTLTLTVPTGFPHRLNVKTFTGTSMTVLGVPNAQVA